MAEAEHGTYARYRQHKRAGDEPCRACRLAWAAYIAGRRMKYKRERDEMRARLAELEAKEAAGLRAAARERTGT